MTTLVIAEHDNASLKPSTLNTVSAALQCGAQVHILVAGHNAGPAAAAAAAIQGVAKVLHAESPAFAHGLAENITAQVTTLTQANSYTHLLFPATAFGKNIAPRVAAKLDVGQISDITKVISADTFERPIYAGNAIATVQSQDPIKVITVRTTGFDAAPTGGNATIETPSAQSASADVSFLRSEIAKNDPGRMFSSTRSTMKAALVTAVVLRREERSAADSKRRRRPRPVCRSVCRALPGSGTDVRRAERGHARRRATPPRPGRAWAPGRRA